jgi:hypothetical protein
LLPSSTEPFTFSPAVKIAKIRIYEAITFPVAVYGCETWSVSLRQKWFENRLLRRIFGPKKDEVTGGWRKLHNVELHNLYSLPSIIRMIKSMRMGLTGHVARMGAKRNAYRILVGKPERKGPQGRTKT